MGEVALTPLDAEALDALAAILAHRALRVDLFGGRADIGHAAAVAIWRAPLAQGDARLAARDAADGRIVGGVGVVRDELVFFVDPARQRLGWGGGVVRALLRLRQEQGLWPRLRAWTLRDNHAARAALAAAGFRDAGLLRNPPGSPVLVAYDCGEPGR